MEQLLVRLGSFADDPVHWLVWSSSENEIIASGVLPDADALKDVCRDVPPEAHTLARHFWPGALSLVLLRAPAVPDAVTAGKSTVAVRVPQHSLARRLCRRLGAPLAATSANPHGYPPPIVAADVAMSLGGRLPLILDGGACHGGVPSTVLDLIVSPPAILRPGPVTAAQLSAVLGCRVTDSHE